jgi:hypothetical protein
MHMRLFGVTGAILGTLGLVTAGAFLAPADPPAMPNPAASENVTVSFHLLLCNAERDQVLNVRFEGDPATVQQFRQKPGVWLRAHGRGLDTNGKVVGRDMRVALRVSAVTALRPAFRVGEHSTVFSVPGDGPDLLYLAHEPGALTRHGTVVDFAGKTAAEFELGPGWQTLELADSEIAGVLAQVYHLLTCPGGGRGAAEWSPTYAECYNGAVEAGYQQGGIKSFCYSCDPETGETVCEWECAGAGADP